MSLRLWGTEGNRSWQSALCWTSLHTVVTKKWVYAVRDKPEWRTLPQKYQTGHRNIHLAMQSNGNVSTQQEFGLGSKTTSSRKEPLSSSFQRTFEGVHDRIKQIPKRNCRNEHEEYRLGVQCICVSLWFQALRSKGRIMLLMNVTLISGQASIPLFDTIYKERVHKSQTSEHPGTSYSF